MAAARRVIKILIPDLLQRLREEEGERSGRRPTKLVLKWRVRGQGWKRTSASCAFPDSRTSKQGESGGAVEAAAVRLLSANLKEPFDMTLINIGATNFVEVGSRNGGGGGDQSIAEMFGGKKEVALLQQQQESIFLPKIPMAGLSAALKIDSSTDGGGGGGIPGVHRNDLSKHGQRQLREMTVVTAGSGAAKIEEARNNIFSNEDVSVDETCLWDDLAELHRSKIVKRPNSQFSINRNTSSGAAVASSPLPLPPQQISDATTMNASAPLQQQQHDFSAPQRGTSLSELHTKPAPVTYRNAEALALQAIFSGGGLPLGDNDDGNDDDDESLKLALKLQREEAEAASGAAAAATTKTAQEQRRKGKKRGPLDGFFIVKKQHK